MRFLQRCVISSRNIIALFLLSSNCMADNDVLKLDHLKVQYAGHIGMLSVGLGKKLNQNIELDLFIGHVPKQEAGIDITTSALKFSHFISHKSNETSMFLDDSFYSVTLLRPHGRQYGYNVKGPHDYSLSLVVIELGTYINNTESKQTNYYLTAGTGSNWFVTSLINKNPLILFENITMAFGLSVPF